jgi:hypothetical protein
MSDSIAPYVSHSPEAEAAVRGEFQDHGSFEDRAIARTENDIAHARRQDLPHDYVPSETQVQDEKVFSDMAAVFDRVEQRESRQRERNPDMPPMPEGSTGDDYMHGLSDWMDKPLAERQRIAEAHSVLEERRAEAKRMGLTISEVEQLKQTAALTAGTAPPEWREVEKLTRTVHPDHAPAATVKHWAGIAEYAQRDPQGAVNWIAQQLGVQPPSGQAGIQPPAFDRDESLRVMESAVGVFIGEHADAQALWPAMIQAVQSKAVSYEPGNYYQMCVNAYEHVKTKPGKRKQSQHTGRPRDVHDEMEAIYDRMAG